MTFFHRACPSCHPFILPSRVLTFGYGSDRLFLVPVVAFIVPDSRTNLYSRTKSGLTTSYHDTRKGFLDRPTKNQIADDTRSTIRIIYIYSTRIYHFSSFVAVSFSSTLSTFNKRNPPLPINRENYHGELLWVTKSGAA